MPARPLPRLLASLVLCTLLVAGLVPAVGTIALLLLAGVGALLAWEGWQAWWRGGQTRDELELTAGLAPVVAILLAVALSQL